MTERDTNTLWISGWMWGKYPEQAHGYQLPQDETEAGEWLEGFRWGTTEACHNTGYGNGWMKHWRGMTPPST